MCNPTGRNYIEQINPEIESRLVDDRDGGEERMGRDGNGYRVSFWGDRNVLERDRGGGCPTP